MEILKILWLAIRICFFFITGRILGLIFYDRNYLQGRWFSRPFGGFGSRGWQWVTTSLVGNFLFQKNLDAKFPISPYCSVINPENVIFHPDDLNNFQSYGIYFQAYGKIVIGRGSYIAPNVGFITANHDPANLSGHLEAKDIILGENCWIGMNAIILRGVILGNNTVVGAGSVVTKSFPEGFCIIAGNPARLIKRLEN